jgi:membrane-bound lytic murein transglycosylase D
MWQFMRSTGRLYMRIDNVVDERLDPVRVERRGRAPARAQPRDHRHLAARDHRLQPRRRRHAARRAHARHHRHGRDRAALPQPELRLRVAQLLRVVPRRVADRPRATRYFGAITLESPNTYTEIELPWYTPAPQLARVLGVDLGRAPGAQPRAAPAVWNGSKHIPKAYPLRLPTSSLSPPVDELIAAVPASARLAEQHRDRFHKVPPRRHAVADREPLRRARERAARREQPAQAQSH